MINAKRFYGTRRDQLVKGKEIFYINPEIVIYLEEADQDTTNVHVTYWREYENIVCIAGDTYEAAKKLLKKWKRFTSVDVDICNGTIINEKGMVYLDPDKINFMTGSEIADATYIHINGADQAITVKGNVDEIARQLNENY